MTINDMKKRFITLVTPILILSMFGCPGSILAETVQMKVTTHLKILPTGKLAVGYDINNLAKETAYHSAVTSFLGNDAQKSDVLGDNPYGGILYYNCEFDTANMKPGNYTLVTRITFNELSGVPHRVYAFNDLAYRPEQVKDAKWALQSRIIPPRFNLKSLWHTDNKFRIALTNTAMGNIQAVAAFYLPDGFSMDEPERFLELPLNGQKEEKIPVKLVDPVTAGKHPYYVVLWYDFNGVHYSQVLQGAITAEEKPVLFKWLLVILAAVALLAGLGYWIHRKRKVA